MTISQVGGIYCRHLVSPTGTTLLSLCCEEPIMNKQLIPGHFQHVHANPKGCSV